METERREIHPELRNTGTLLVIVSLIVGVLSVTLISYIFNSRLGIVAFIVAYYVYRYSLIYIARRRNIPTHVIRKFSPEEIAENERNSSTSAQLKKGGKFALIILLGLTGVFAAIIILGLIFGVESS